MPVFGRPDVAAAGKLFIVAAGAPEAFEACLPLFSTWFIPVSNRNWCAYYLVTSIDYTLGFKKGPEQLPISF